MMQISRRKALGLIGTGAISVPTILSGCEAPTVTLGPKDYYVEFPGSITYAYNYPSSKWNIIVSDWNNETVFNITSNIPGNHQQPVFGSNGEVYFCSEINIEANVLERSISVITDIHNPEGSLEQLVLSITNGDHYEWIVRPEISPDGSRLMYSRTVYQAPEESGLYAIDLPTSTPYPIFSGLSGTVGQTALIPGTNSLLFTHTNISSPSSLRVADLDTGDVVDYLFTAINEGTGVSLNEAAFSTIVIDRNKRVYGVSTEPGGTYSLVQIYSWDYDDPSTVSRSGATVIRSNTVLSYLWRDLRLVEHLDSEEDYILMSYSRKYTDRHYSLGYSKLSSVEGPDWEPIFIPAMTNGHARGIDWTPFSINEL